MESRGEMVGHPLVCPGSVPLHTAPYSGQTDTQLSTNGPVNQTYRIRSLTRARNNTMLAKDTRIHRWDIKANRELKASRNAFF